MKITSLQIHCVRNGFLLLSLLVLLFWLLPKCSYSFIVVEDDENALSSNDKYAKVCANDENK